MASTQHKQIVVLFLLASLCVARDLSCRLRAFGDEFALLIPDYETDVWYNPIFIDKNMLCINYKTYEETPIKIGFLYRTVGFYGLYWPSHNYNFTTNNNDWSSHSILNDRLKIIFLSKIKNIGLAITPDISRLRDKIWTSADYQEIESSQKFLLKSSMGLRFMVSLIRTLWMAVMIRTVTPQTE